MTKKVIREALRAGEIAVGFWQFILSPDVTEMIGEAGFDFVLLDTEHTGASIDTVRACLTAADAASIATVVRVAEKNQRYMIEQVLDAGAQGVLVPTVETKEEALFAVKSAKFAPQGERGYCPAIRSGRWSSRPGFASRANEETFVGIIVESPLGLANLQEMLTVDGLDGVMIGGVDLSLRLGPNLERESLQTMTDEALRSITASNKVAWLSVGDVSVARRSRAQMVCAGADVSILTAALKAALGVGRSDVASERREGVRAASR